MNQFTTESEHHSRPRSAYVHVPFCRHRCGYCNFTLVAGRDDLIPKYLLALQRELALQGEAAEVDTLFFGGGTPTHLAPTAFSQLAQHVLAQFPLAAAGEWSVEANPADLTETMCRLLADLGVTRLSIGGQSFDDHKLAALDRDHTGAEFTQAIQCCMQFFKNVSIDLIFGAPGDTFETWAADLERSIALGPQHISTYGLTFERGTRFWSRRERSEIQALDEDLESEMYERAIDVLTAAGYEHYEVSNFARPGYRCRHNENYWLGGSFFGVGPGAASYIEGTRRLNHRSPFTYIQRLLSGRSAEADAETLSGEDRAREQFVFAMRRIEGVDRSFFRSLSGYDVNDLFGDVLSRYIALGLLEECDDRIRLTRRGLLVSDSIWPDFLVPTHNSQQMAPPSSMKTNA